MGGGGVIRGSVIFRKFCNFDLMLFDSKVNKDF